MINVDVSVDDLILIPFAQRPYAERESIVKNGKPKPELPNLTLMHKEKNREYRRQFSTHLYDSKDWLTGCDKRNRLFCWPCLLFSCDRGTWTTKGHDDLRCLSKLLKRHEQSSAHHRSHWTLKMFGRNSGINGLTRKQHMMRNKVHNDTVRNNIEIMKRLIDSVYFLAKQDKPYNADEESEDSLDNGNHMDCLDYLRIYDPFLDEQLKTSTIFRDSTPSVQNDLIDAVSAVINQHIEEEIKDSAFASIILDSASHITSQFQLSSVIRYVYMGEARERFVGFSDVSSDRNANALFDHVVKIACEFGIEEKIMGQAYDGASVKSEDLDELQRMVVNKFPQALFVHCHAHVPSLILQQGLKSVDNCGMFFRKLNALSAFFSKSQEITRVLVKFMNRKLWVVDRTHWNFTSDLVNTVNDELVNFIEFFIHVNNDVDGNWDGDSIVKAGGFLSFLNDFQTVLYLEMFAQIFSLTDDLYGILQAQPYDVLFCFERILGVKAQLQENCDYQFDSIWNSALSKYGSIESLSGMWVKIEFEDNNSARRTYFDIIDNVCNQIEIRYQSFKKLEFINLLHHPKYSVYRERFPDDLLNTLKLSYESTFDLIKLKSELSVIYCSPDLSDKSVSQLIQFMTQNDILSVFPESIKLADLILSLPNMPPDASFDWSCEQTLSRIHSFIKVTPSPERRKQLSTISIEREVIDQLRNNGTLYDKVLKEFKRKNQVIDLEYK